MRFADRVALVTGGGSGIGAASAHLLAREGARVAILSRTLDDLEAVARRIDEDGGEALPIAADVSDPDAMVEACGQTAERWGRLDLLFANAGVNGVWAPLDELEPDEWRHTIDVNLSGTFYTIRAAFPHLRRAGGAVVVNASVNGTRMFSNTGATAYASSKAGQAALAKMLALELAKHRIRVNVICPGAIETDIGERTEHQSLDRAQEPVEFPAGKIPLTDGRPGETGQVAELVAFLLSDGASHITGTEVWIDGGQSLLQG